MRDHDFRRQLTDLLVDERRLGFMGKSLDDLPKSCAGEGAALFTLHMD
jgi:hypothetical protein